MHVDVTGAGAEPRQTPIVLRAPLTEGAEPWLVFYLGVSGDRLDERTDSYSVVATIHYAGFQEPTAKIDWGDGRGYRAAETRQGNPWHLTNTYRTRGRKEARFLVEGQDGIRRERPASIEVAPAGSMADVLGRVVSVRQERATK